MEALHSSFVIEGSLQFPGPTGAGRIVESAVKSIVERPVGGGVRSGNGGVVNISVGLGEKSGTGGGGGGLVNTSVERVVKIIVASSVGIGVGRGVGGSVAISSRKSLTNTNLPLS